MGDAVRVVHVIPSIARSAGGPSEVIRSLLPAQRAVGIDARLVTTTKWAAPLDGDLLNEADTIAARCMVSRWTFAPGVIPPLWREIGRADVVHVHSIHTFTSTVAMLISWMRRRPVVLEPHGALNKYHFSRSRRSKMLYLRWVDALGLRAVRAVLCSSSREGREAEEVLGRKSTCIPLGVDPGLLSIPIQRDASVVSVLFLGRVATSKRLDLLLEAMSDEDVRAEGIRLTVAGPIESTLNFDPSLIVRECGISENVEFAGQVDSAERFRLMSSANLFVLLSDDESFGLSVAEAMAAGLPVICSPHVGVAEDARTHGASLIIPQDAGRLAQEIVRLARGPHLRLAMARRSREYALSALTWSGIAGDMARLYGHAKMLQAASERKQAVR